MARGTTKNNGQKGKLDRFYTPADEALRLLSDLPAIVPLLAGNPDCSGIEFYEPSAGDGAFVRAVEELYPSASVRAFDIAPPCSPPCDKIGGELLFLPASPFRLPASPSLRFPGFHHICVVIVDCLNLYI